MIIYRDVGHFVVLARMDDEVTDMTEANYFSYLFYFFITIFCRTLDYDKTKKTKKIKSFW